MFEKSNARSFESEQKILCAVEWLKQKFSNEVHSKRNDEYTALFMSGEMLECLEKATLASEGILCSPRKSLENFRLKLPRSGPPDLHAAVLTFSARLLMYVNELWDGKASEVYHRARVSRKIYSRIISNNQAKAAKETVMKFAIGLQLDMDQAELLMRSAGYSFSSSIPWDMAFVYCIENKIWDLDDLNEILIRSGYKGIELD